LSNEPPNTTPAWFTLSGVEWFGGVRGGRLPLGSQPATRLGFRYIILLLL